MTKKIILHWDAGSGTINKTNQEHYHEMVDKKAIIHKGKYTIADNDNCKDGKYAQHTAGMNTNNIGFSFLGMGDYIFNSKKTKFPINEKQLEVGLKRIAELCKEYNILITEDNIMTHYEVSNKVRVGKIPKNDFTVNNIGKIDFYWLSCQPELKPQEIGDYLRNKIKWYFDKIA